MEFTGERVIPGRVEPDLWAEHLSRYAFAARWAAQARVLDLGCGAGYGTAELARSASAAVGIDSSPEATAYARSTYAISNLAFLLASVTAVPFRDGSFDLVTAFEVIEHLDDWRALLAEAQRLLRSGGVFLVSTPNKEYYGASRGASGPNPFHLHEFEFDEFKKELEQLFPNCTVLLQNHVEGFAFYQHETSASESKRGGMSIEGRMETVRGAPQEAHFFLAVCSSERLSAEPKLAAAPGFVFIPQGSNVLREREKHIQSLKQELQGAREQFTALHRAHNELTVHLENQNRWVLSTAEELAAARRDIASLVEKLTAAEATVIERTLWAQSLDAQRQTLAAEVQRLLPEEKRLVSEVDRLLSERSRLASELQLQASELQGLKNEVQRLASEGLHLAEQVENREERINLWRASRWAKLGRKLNLGPDLDLLPAKGNAGSVGS